MKSFIRINRAKQRIEKLQSIIDNTPIPSGVYQQMEYDNLMLSLRREIKLIKNSLNKKGIEL